MGFWKHVNTPLPSYPASQFICRHHKADVETSGRHQRQFKLKITLLSMCSVLPFASFPSWMAWGMECLPLVSLWRSEGLQNTPQERNIENWLFACSELKEEQEERERICFHSVLYRLFGEKNEDPQCKHSIDFLIIEDKTISSWCRNGCLLPASG